MKPHLFTGTFAPQHRTLAGPWLALCCVLTYSPLAHADSSDPRARGETHSSQVPPTYRQLIDEALREYNAQHFARALVLFERAHELWPNARTLRGLGKVSFELRRYRAAIDYLERARASGAQPLDDAMRRDAERLEAHARSYLGHVLVDLEPTTAHFRLDGLDAHVEPNRPLSLDPGEHALEVLAPGYVTERRVYALAVSEQTTWTIHLRAATNPVAYVGPSAVARTPRAAAQTLPETAPSAARAQTDAGAGSRWLLPTGLTLAFAGAATTGVAAGLFVAYLDNGEKLRQPNHLTLQYRDRWLSSRNRVLVVSGIGTGLLTLGAAALADSIPPAERPWLSSTLAVAGAVVLVTGISLYAANNCNTQADVTLRTCSMRIERRDAGSLLAMLSIPLLTIPVVHAVQWLVHHK